MPKFDAHRLASALAVPVIAAFVGSQAQAGMNGVQWAGGLLAASAAVLWAAMAHAPPRA